MMAIGDHRRKRAALVWVGGVALAAAAVAQQPASQAPGQGQGTTSDAQIEANVLRALAGAPELSTQNIQTTTVYGVVTITGNVHDEPMRSKAENLVARVNGVKKVVDELTLGDTPPPQQGDQAQQAQGGYPDQASPQGQYQGPPQQGPESYSAPPQGGYGQQQAPPPQYGQQAPPPQPGYGQPPYGQPGQPQYGQQPGYPQGAPPPAGYASAGAPQGGQVAGMDVTVAPGSMLRVRVDRGLDSKHTAPGTIFYGTVLSDVSATGAVAIPRGASVQGVVVDAKKAGVLAGQGKIVLQITSVSLGGVVYPLQSSTWQVDGPNKTTRTVDSAVATGAVGAILGAVVGGGRGAAIGAGVGAGAGVAGSAASPSGQAFIPPEAVLNFSLTAPVTVKTVSEAEMQRLAYNAGPAGARPALVRRRYYPPYPYGYYPAPPPAPAPYPY